MELQKNAFVTSRLLICFVGKFVYNGTKGSLVSKVDSLAVVPHI